MTMYKYGLVLFCRSGNVYIKAKIKKVTLVIKIYTFEKQCVNKQLFEMFVSTFVH